MLGFDGRDDVDGFGFAIQLNCVLVLLSGVLVFLHCEFLL